MRRALAGALLALAALPAAASGARVAQPVTFTASDGVALRTTVSGEAPLRARPTIVEFSPYGRGSQSVDPGPAYNLLLVQIRGTGDSHGRFDALGPRTQQDVAEVLGWACRQPWSDGRLGLNGFSASAITIYNSLHRRLPCVSGAVLRSGTFELYRDLLVPGAINNLVPGAGVLALIGGPALAQAPDRDPATGTDTIAGLFGAGLSDLQHPRQDAWWRDRGFRGDVNHLPILMVDGWFDVESRGAFQAFQALRRDGAHLLVTGAHDGSPKGTDGAVPQTRAWFDRFVRGVRNGADRGPRVRMLLSRGDREDYLGGDFERLDASAWPPRGTRWTPLALDGSALALAAPRAAATRSYPLLPSLFSATDPPNAAIVGAGGLNALTTALPVLSDMTLAAPLGVGFRTAPLRRDVVGVGPPALELWLSSTAPQANIWAVLSDVSPDGIAHPLTAGRLNTDFPEVDKARSLVERRTRRIVQPYGRFDVARPATPGVARRYRVELWPVGNRFRAGHRIGLDVLGSSIASAPGAPGVATVRLGGDHPSRLLFAVLPGSDLRAALGG